MAQKISNRRPKPNRSAVKVGEYSLLNRQKLERVIEGELGTAGQPVQRKNRHNNLVVIGVGKEAPEELVLACYDRLGGAIKHNGLLVERGCFWDFVNDCPRKNPKVEYRGQERTKGGVVVDDKVADKGSKKREGELNASAGAVELAEANGIDLSQVEGSGSGGRILKADVQALVDGATNVDGETNNA